MLSDKIIILIDTLQKNVFEDRMTDFADLFMQLAGELELLSVCLSAQRRPELNQILDAVLDAYENRDYVLMADFFEFELKPFLRATFLGGQ